MELLSFKELIKKFPSVWDLYWNNKFPKGIIKYRTITGGEPVDVRTLLEPTHQELVKIGDSLRTRWVTDDEVSLNALRWVAANIFYVADSKKHGQPEHWQDAPETYATKSGDCEDGAILLMKLLEHAGIPAWRRKLCCGWVKSGGGQAGHAYCIYLADDFEWYVLDWCYWFMDSVGFFKKVPHRKRIEYIDIWWTFNEKFCWTEHKYLYVG